MFANASKSAGASACFLTALFRIIVSLKIETLIARVVLWMRELGVNEDNGNIRWLEIRMTLRWFTCLIPVQTGKSKSARHRLLSMLSPLHTPKTTTRKQLSTWLSSLTLTSAVAACYSALVHKYTSPKKLKAWNPKITNIKNKTALSKENLSDYARWHVFPCEYIVYI